MKVLLKKNMHCNLVLNQFFVKHQCKIQIEGIIHLQYLLFIYKHTELVFDLPLSCSGTRISWLTCAPLGGSRCQHRGTAAVHPHDSGRVHRTRRSSR